MNNSDKLIADFFFFKNENMCKHCVLIRQSCYQGCLKIAARLAGWPQHKSLLNHKQRKEGPSVGGLRGLVRKGSPICRSRMGQTLAGPACAGLCMPSFL